MLDTGSALLTENIAIQTFIADLVPGQQLLPPWIARASRGDGLAQPAFQHGPHRVPADLPQQQIGIDEGRAGRRRRNWPTKAG
ncbi:hypothetical protein [Rhizorhabdus wittichii]